MNAASSDRRGPVPASQRPTMEMLEDDTLEIETLPPAANASDPPDSSPGRPTVPGPHLPSWSALSEGAGMPIELELRLLLGILQALIPLHTNLRLSPRERAYGRVCYQNVIIEPDGSVRLRAIEEAIELPGDLRAPELDGGAPVDQQGDLYAIGALLLGLILRHDVEGESDAMLERLRVVATRAVRHDPLSRWASAAEFAEELENAAGARLHSAEALVVFTRDQQSRVEADARATPVLSRLPPLPRPQEAPYEPVDRQALAVPIDLDQEGGVELIAEPAVATSGLPHPSPPRRSLKMFASLCIAFVLIGGVAFALWNDDPAPIAETSDTSPKGAEPGLTTAPRDPEPVLATIDVGGDVGSPKAASPLDLSTRPTSSGSFAPLGTSANPKKPPPPNKPNTERRNSSTYDPEGI
jgi:hypothetical protein